jgi:hypothetical protein
LKFALIIFKFSVISSFLFTLIFINLSHDFILIDSSVVNIIELIHGVFDKLIISHIFELTSQRETFSGLYVRLKDRLLTSFIFLFAIIYKLSSNFSIEISDLFSCIQEFNTLAFRF